MREILLPVQVGADRRKQGWGVSPPTNYCINTRMPEEWLLNSGAYMH